MNDKVIVQIIVPEINQTYDLFLPISKKMGTIISLLNKGINELTNGEFPMSTRCQLYNAVSLKVYESNILLFNTDIRNGTKLVLLINN